MGVLRYFPGSEPRDDDEPGATTETGAAASDRDERAVAVGRARDTAIGREVEPAWTVPGVDPQGAGARPSPGIDRPVEDGSAARGAGSAGVSSAHPSRGTRRAENVSMAALTSHDLSESEMRSRLAARGLEPDDVEAEVARLLGAGLLDDAALADTLILRLRDRKGLGDAALRPALRARGIPPQVIDTALAGASDDDETAHQRLQEVAEDRARRLGGLAPAVAERRLLAYLARKGYSGSDARSAARAALAGGGPD